MRESISKMMELGSHNVSFNELLEFGDGWYNHYTITVSKEKEFKKWFLSEAVKRGVASTRKIAERKWNFFNLKYGLRISDIENI